MLPRMRWMIPLAVLTCQVEPVLADVLTDWNEKTVAFVTPRMVPAAGQRVVAMVQVAMFDAINSVERRYRPYLEQLPATPTTSREAAAAAAAAEPPAKDLLRNPGRHQPADHRPVHQRPGAVRQHLPALPAEDLPRPAPLPRRADQALPAAQAPRGEPARGGRTAGEGETR